VTSVAPTKGERTRARVLDEAVQRFATGGFRGTSVAAIARAAGVTPAAVYSYFEGKEGLFDAAVDHDAAALIQEVLEAGGWPQGEAWVQVIPRLVERLDDHPLAKRVLAGHEADAVVRLLQIPALQDLEAKVADDLRLGQELGLVRTDIDVGLMAQGLESLVLALLIAMVQTGIGLTDARRAQSVFAVLSSAIRPAASPGAASPPPAAGP
jgi:AcrR family transcriptional regulator